MTWTNSKGKVHGFLGRMNLIREDGRIEQLCKHGVGHPIGHVNKWLDWMGSHGCDGCCCKAEFYLPAAEGARLDSETT